MGFRFRTSFKLCPGIRINMTQRGLTSLSVGRPGATVNLSSRGVRGTVGIPGSGLSYSQQLASPAAASGSALIDTVDPAPQRSAEQSAMAQKAAYGAGNGLGRLVGRYPKLFVLAIVPVFAATIVYSMPSASEPAAPATAAIAAHANPAHEQISSMSEEQRRSVLTAFLVKSGEKCTVTKTFYQGSDNKGNAFWNAACARGSSFAIQVNNDATGSTRVLGCKVLKAVNAGTCFTKFKAEAL